MPETEEGVSIPQVTFVPQNPTPIFSEYAWISTLSQLDHDTADKVLALIGRDIDLKELAMSHELELDKERMRQHAKAMDARSKIEKDQLDREDYFNRWGLILSFGIVVLALSIGAVLIQGGQVYGGVVTIVIGAGLGSGSIANIANKIMGKIFNKSNVKE